MAPPRRINPVFRFFILSLVVILQVPGLWLLRWLFGNAALILPLFLTLNFLNLLRKPFSEPPKSLIYRYAILFPFFAWWVGCLLMALLGTVRPGRRRALACLAAAALRGRAGAVARGRRLVADSAAQAGGGRGAAGRPARRARRLSHRADFRRAPGRLHLGRARRRLGRAAQRRQARPHRGDRRPHHVRASARRGGGRADGGRRGTDGVYACMGNHDYFVDDAESMPRALARHGIVVLRNQGQRVRDGLYIAGVDYTWTKRADVNALDGVPTLSTDRVRRKAGDTAPPPETPLILVGRDGRRRVVLAADAAAQAAGLRVGMPASKAQALVRGLVIQDADPTADAAALDRLALWMFSASPQSSPPIRRTESSSTPPAQIICTVERALCSRSWSRSSLAWA